MPAEGLARILIIVGSTILIVGVLVYIFGRLGISLGNLPGDFRYESEKMTCVFPLATSILLSLVLTVILNLIFRGLNK